MKLRIGIGVTLALLGGWQLGSAGYLHAKALLAQQLLKSAWQRSLAGEHEARPWPWADTVPVALLRAPAQGSELIVLSNASGRALAFGPAHVSGTAPPGESGTSVIAGHRDTHFAFLRSLRPGDPIDIQRKDGVVVRYLVTRIRVIDSRHASLPLDVIDDVLRLVTCFPFDAIDPGGPLRFEVTAVPEGRRDARDIPKETAVATSKSKVMS